MSKAHDSLEVNFEVLRDRAESYLDANGQEEYILNGINANPSFKRQICAAITTFNELDLWKMDNVKFDLDALIRAWALMETVRKKGFPENLKL